MALTTYVFNQVVKSLLAGELGVVDGSTTIKCALFTSAYAPSADARYLGELLGEVTDASYARQTATGVVVSYDAATDTTTVDCNDVQFPNLTATIRYVVFYRAVGGDATSPLIVCWDLGADETSNAAPYTATIAPEGLITFTKAA